MLGKISQALVCSHLNAHIKKKRGTECLHAGQFHLQSTFQRVETHG